MSTIEWRRANRERILQKQRNWYHQNASKVKRNVQNRKAERSKWLAELKSHLVCARCGENHPAVLDFHHKASSQKDIAIAETVSYGWSKERILKEIEKCEVLCSNCHRKEHFSTLENAFVT